jgi:CP family cyanate transporter-like MFS transporter
MPSSPAARNGTLLLALGVVLIAANLRPTVTSVAPLLSQIRADLVLSSTAASLLTATPVLCFGLLAPFAPRIADRLGMERTLGIVLLAITAGLAIRIGPGAATLFGGTILAGGAIALGNVLLPALVKRDFPGRAGAITGVYTMALQIAAALAAGLSVPIASALGGWRAGLGVWSLAAIATFAIGLPQLRHRTVPVVAAVVGSVGTLLRSPLAWQVTLFFGLQSLEFYAIVSWLPTIYQDAGFNPSDAGLVLSVSTLAGAPAALIMPSIATRAGDQRWHAIAVCVLIGAGLLGVVVAPLSQPWLWAVLIGFGNGASFPLALTLLVVRTRSSTDTARLSAMAQSVGYLIAALGPIVVGVVHDLTGSWSAAVGVLLVMLGPQTLFGVLAGRAVLLGAASDRPAGAATT